MASRQMVLKAFRTSILTRTRGVFELVVSVPMYSRTACTAASHPRGCRLRAEWGAAPDRALLRCVSLRYVRAGDDTHFLRLSDVAHRSFSAGRKVTLHKGHRDRIRVLDRSAPGWQEPLGRLGDGGRIRRPPWRAAGVGVVVGRRQDRQMSPVAW